MFNLIFVNKEENCTKICQVKFQMHKIENCMKLVLCKLFLISRTLYYVNAWFRLQVVSTKVGGVPEVLPPEMIRLAEPSVTGTVLVGTRHGVCV